MRKKRARGTPGGKAHRGGTAAANKKGETRRQKGVTRWAPTTKSKELRPVREEGKESRKKARKIEGGEA